MKIGLVGYGSIGQRHAELLKEFGDEVIVLTRNVQCPFKVVKSIAELISAGVEKILVSNETSLHLQTYKEIRSLAPQIPLLIEKPLFADRIEMKDDPNCWVAYCLRYHPLVMRVREAIGNQKILSAHFYVGQYLPDWRPGRDYREVYSAKKSMGGGVMRDLSHEIDLAKFIAGEFKAVKTLAKKVSDLEIDTDDTFSGIFAGECPLITVQLNYLDRITQRYFIVLTKDNSYRVDFVAGTISENQKVESVKVERNEMYRRMLSNFRNGTMKELTTFREGLEIARIFTETEERQ